MDEFFFLFNTYLRLVSYRSSVHFAELELQVCVNAGHTHLVPLEIH